jgi:uncharacterized protein (UPF0335 family)
MGKSPIADEDTAEDGGNVSLSSKRLASFIQRVEKLNEEKKNLSEDIKEVFSEAKSAGFDTKTIRDIIKRRKLDPADRDEQDALLATYETALDSVLG